MNFFDPSLPGTSTPPPANQMEPTLNDEVSQVIGQLGRFWGGLRRQSQSALQTARKDFGDVVLQAQKELGKLAGDTPSTQSEENTAQDAEEDVSQAGSSSQVETPVETSPPAERDLSASSLFARIQSAIPPNIVSTAETLKHATESIDLAQLRTTLTTEFQRVQGVTMAHAGEYVQKSEDLLREVVKEAGEVLRDAVKVIPPEGEESTFIAPGPLWDGVDMSLPSGGDQGKGKAREGSFGESSAETQLTAATRVEALLKQLKQNPAILRHDPEEDERVRDLYRSWAQSEVDDKGGVEAEEWTKRISALLSEDEDGQALQSSLESLVPTELTKDQFWKRYFFRVHQIEREEEKRKVLLRGHTENEELFSWEDEDEEPMSPTPGAKSLSNSQEIPGPAPSSLGTVLTRKLSVQRVKASAVVSEEATSPRTGSEDSYDLLSSENASAAGDSKGKHKAGDDDGDSDWE